MTLLGWPLLSNSTVRVWVFRTVPELSLMVVVSVVFLYGVT